MAQLSHRLIGATGATGAKGSDGADGQDADPAVTYGAIGSGLLIIVVATNAIMKSLATKKLQWTVKIQQLLILSTNDLISKYYKNKK